LYDCSTDEDEYSTVEEESMGEDEEEEEEEEEEVSSRWHLPLEVPITEVSSSVGHSMSFSAD
jgi:hypothetical protein